MSTKPKDLTVQAAPLPTPRPELTRRLALLAGSLALAGLFRWFVHPSISPRSLWIDDTWVVLAIRADSLQEAWLTVVTTPGFTMLVAGWLKLVGFTEARAQALPLLFGAAAGPALLWAVRQHWRGTAAPALAGLLTAISPLLILQAPRVKQYSLDVLVCAVMVGVALRVTSQDDESRARRGAWWLTVLTLASVVMSAAVAPVAAALVFAVGTQALLDASPREGRHRGGAVAPAGTFFGFALLWYVGVLRQTIPEGMHRFWQSKFLDVTPVPALVDEVSAGVQVVLGQAASLPFALVGLLVLAGLGTTIARGLRLRSAGESAAAEFVLISVMVLPWLASLALALLHRAPWGGGRTDSALVVPVVLALTAIFASRPARRSLTVLAVAAAAALATAAVVRTESSLYPDEDMRQLVASAQLHEEDAILVNGGSIYPYGFYATTRVTVQSSRGLNGFAPRFDDERVRLLASDPNRPETYLSRVTAALGDDCHAWFFASHPVRDIQPTEAALVSLGFTKDRTLQFGPARATHWTLGC